MNRIILITASILGLTSIILGAFFAHGLKGLISMASQHTFEIGIRYQMYHAFLLLFIGTTNLIKQRTKTIVYYLIVVGVFLFSGSIYGLSTNELSSLNFKTIGILTPLGGLLLILAWVFMLLDFIGISSKNRV